MLQCIQPIDISLINRFSMSRWIQTTRSVSIPPSDPTNDNLKEKLKKVFVPNFHIARINPIGWRAKNDFHFVSHRPLVSLELAHSIIYCLGNSSSQMPERIATDLVGQSGSQPDQLTWFLEFVSYPGF